MELIEIKIAGILDINWDQWIQGFDICHGDQDDTILTGPVRDQAELYGLIAKLRDLGVKLISVNNLGKYSVDQE